MSNLVVATPKFDIVPNSTKNFRGTSGWAKTQNKVEFNVQGVPITVVYEQFTQMCRAKNHEGVIVLITKISEDTTHRNRHNERSWSVSELVQGVAKKVEYEEIRKTKDGEEFKSQQYFYASDLPEIQEKPQLEDGKYYLITEHTLKGSVFATTCVSWDDVKQEFPDHKKLKREAKKAALAAAQE